MTTTKPRLSLTQIINMSVGFFGIQVGFALQNANTSRIFQTLGAEMNELAVLWIAAPMTGLIVQPIIGYFSDKTWHPVLGRRRIFFLIGAILASIALFMMPNSPTLWFAASMLWIMDASINVSMEPFRAFVGDLLPDSQRTTGFVMQSLFIGLGAYLASLLPNYFEYSGVSNTAPDGVIPDTVKYAYYLGGVVFLLCILWTVFSTKEYSPKEMAEFEGENFEEYKEGDRGNQSQIQLIIGLGLLLFSLVFTYLIYVNGLEKELYIFSLGILGLFGLVFIFSSILQYQGKTNGFVDSVNDFQFMPKVMKQLAVVQFFSWFALFAMWIYSTPAITSFKFDTTDPKSEAYGTGANLVNEFFANYNLVAAIFSILLILVLQKIKIERKFIHFFCLIIGGLGLISIYYLDNHNLLIWLPSIGIGLAWASILSIPYAMLTKVLPSNKLGYYMGVFNYFIVIPQLVAASILGAIISRFDNQPIYALIIGGASLVIAAIFTLFIRESKENA